MNTEVPKKSNKKAWSIAIGVYLLLIVLAIISIGTCGRTAGHNWNGSVWWASGELCAALTKP